MQQKNWLTTNTENPGFLYVMSNPTHNNSVKIGKTTRLPGYRAAELSASTGVPVPFKVEYARFVEKDLDCIETRIHEQLAEHRVNTSREFFGLPISEAISRVDEIIDEYFSYKFGDVIYRTSQHARWGLLFEFIELPFEYLTAPVKLIGDNTFQPDFQLPEQDCFLVISQDLLSTPVGRLASAYFAEKTRKVLIQLWDCMPGVEHIADGGIIIHTGSYMTPEGYCDGAIELGLCEHCNSRHIGHLGCAELCDPEIRNTSPVNCKCFYPETHPLLLRGFKMVQHIFDGEEI